MLRTLTAQTGKLTLRAGCSARSTVALRRSSWWSKIIYPFSQDEGAGPAQSYVKTGKNQCFLPIRSDDELNEVLMFNNRAPLILNFTVRGTDPCNKLTGALNRIVLLETEKRINICDVETDFLDTREAMLRFGVHKVPTLVAVRKTFPVDVYSPENPHELNWLELKAWIEKNADD